MKTIWFGGCPEVNAFQIFPISGNTKILERKRDSDFDSLTRKGLRESVEMIVQRERQ